MDNRELSVCAECGCVVAGEMCIKCGRHTERHDIGLAYTALNARLIAAANRAESLARRVEELENALKSCRDDLHTEIYNTTYNKHQNESRARDRAALCCSDYDAALAAKGAKPEPPHPTGNVATANP